MEVLPISTESIQNALDVLRHGGVVAHATETCYGLACDLTNPKAVARLFEVKKRPLDQPVSALFSSIEQAKKYVVFSERALELAEKHMPGPLTLVLPIRSDSPSIFVIPLEKIPNRSDQIPNTTIGVRVSSHPVAQELVLKFGRPIATTSANLHGQSNPYSAEEIVSQFASADVVPGLIIDSGKLSLVPPSMIVEVSGEELRILRKGAIDISSLHHS